MILFCLAGFLVPGLSRLPNESVAVALAVLMFFSCYRWRDGGSGSSGNLWRDVGAFYLLRYGFLPAAIWSVLHKLAPDQATGAFLLSVVPAAVSGPVFTSLYGGAVPVAFAIVLISQFAAPFLIPLQFSWIGGLQSLPEPAHLFRTLALCILLPIAVYTFVRKHRASADFFYGQSKAAAVVLASFMISIAVAKQRDVILSGGTALLRPLLISTLCFLIYIAFAWFLTAFRPREQRIAYATCSGFNNAGLGVSLALLHFSAPVILFVAVSEMGWSLLPVMMRGFFGRTRKKVV